MPNQNAIVGLVDRIEAQVEKQTSAELSRRYPDGIVVLFENNQAARLYPGERAAGMLHILEQLRQMRAPVYVEVDPDNRGIMRLLIPLVTRVANVSESKGEEIRVELELSHARHLLKRKNPDFADLLEILLAAMRSKTWLMVTETDEHEIIDVRPSPLEPKLHDLTEANPQRERPGAFRRFWHRWFGCLCCVSPRRAQHFFDLCSSKTCDPLTVPPPCIPFLYPDDGCWARAHEMCRLMIAEGAKPKKVWIDGNLHTLTKNNPQCYVDWGWHVAPTICVKRSFWRCEYMVIDPSLFTTPVTKGTWKGVQGDTSATLTDTAATVYWRNVIPTDPTYSDTNFRLQYYRLQLQNRSLQPAGPPPYAFCP